MDLKGAWALLKETAHEWSEDKVPRLGAALAFYSALSLAPLLVISIAIAALAFPDQASARGRLIAQIESLTGKSGGEAIRSTIASARNPQQGSLAGLLGLATLLFGASGVFGSLQDSLNTIWEVEPKPGRGLWGILKDRFLSFSMVLGTGFLLLISLVITTALEAVESYFHGLLPSWAPILQVVNFVVTFAVVTLLFAMIFKYLPDVEIAWNDVWLGSLATALLFTVGKYAIGLYLGRSTFGSSYGAAGSFVVFLIWIYYSAQILFFGAEFTKVYAKSRGSRIRPARDAVPITEEARAHQGIPHHDSRTGGQQTPSPTRRPEPARIAANRLGPAVSPRSVSGIAAPDEPVRTTPGRWSPLALGGAAVAGVLAALTVRAWLSDAEDEEQTVQ